MSNNKSLILKTFYNQLFQFLDDILNIIPSDDIKTSKKYLLSMQSLNPSLIIKIWYNHIEKPYHNEIQNKDINFFLEKDYSADLENLQNASEILNIINNSIREPLKNMTPTNLEHCKTYIKLISELSLKYTQL